MGNSGLNIDKAVDQINKAGPATQHRCAHFVRLAIQAGGVNLHFYPINAKDYGKNLLIAGFSVVQKENYSPQKGDIVVFQSCPGGNLAGHIQMYNGVQWVSDFKQVVHDIWPGPGYRNTKPDYAIYRP